jgi:hypothetical protein
LSLSVPRYPPWGPLAKVAATAAKRPLRGRLGSRAGPTVRLAAHALTVALCAPNQRIRNATPLDGVEVPRASTS